ncbi:MAG: helix-turn-helix transcriptional regulator [Lachnospiraceae bacterium]|nr:helix-turn-helix transcriptional regulator [Lachnospiraceae bacterium]
MKQNYNFKRGRNNIDMILLKILCNGDFYGYQLSQLIKEFSHDMVSIPEGSLYPALYKLQDNGYISAEKRLVGKRQERIYYHIEPSGRDYLQTVLSDYEYLTTAIQYILSYQYTPQEESESE